MEPRSHFWRVERWRVRSDRGWSVSHWHWQRRGDLGARPRRLHRHRRFEGHTRTHSLYWPLSDGHEPLLARRANGPYHPRRCAGYSILKGADGVDPYAVHAKDAQPADPRIDGQTIRVGWVSEAAFGPVDPEITAAVAAAAARLKDLGCDVEGVRLPFMEQTDWLTPFFTLWYEIVPYLQKFATGREADMHAVGAGLMATPPPSIVDYINAEAKVEQLKTAFAGYFQKYEVLLCPVNPFTAPPHGLQELVVDRVTVPAYHVLRATAPFNMTGLPALSVPFAFSSEQLPIGIQLVSRWLDEATILRLGALLERSGGLGSRHPDI
jgi:aspartyl-tRNA(Asn)/glutamyl-tRNA(Gln) amidotransferase subunit A